MFREINDDCIDILKLMSDIVISQENYDDIYEICQRYSRGTSWPRNPWDILDIINKTTIVGITRVEIDECKWKRK